MEKYKVGLEAWGILSEQYFYVEDGIVLAYTLDSRGIEEDEPTWAPAEPGLAVCFRANPHFGPVSVMPRIGSYPEFVSRCNARVDSRKVKSIDEHFENPLK